MNISLELPRDTAIPRRSPAVGVTSIAVALTVGGALVHLVNLGGPGFTYDEVATISGARRSLASLWLLVQHVDAVHGLYYGFMHVWGHFFGWSEFSLRLPSVIAVSLTAPLVYLISRRFGRGDVGVVAAISLIFLPRVLWLSGMARSPAIDMCVATLLSLLLSTLMTSTLTPLARRMGYVAYGTLALIGSVLWVYLPLVLVAHVCTLFLCRSAHRWRIAALTGLVLAAISPFALVVVGQRAQLGGVDARDLPSLWARIFWGLITERGAGETSATSIAVSIIIWGVVAACVVTWVARRDKRRISAADRSLLLVALPWFAIPQLALAATSLVAGPIYQAKALSFSIPAFALLLGFGIAYVGSRAWAMAGMTLSLAATSVGVPMLINPIPPGGANLRLSAESLHALAKPGDAVLFPIPSNINQTLFTIPIAYPDAMEGLANPLQVTRYSASTSLWGERTTMTRGKIEPYHRVWVILPNTNLAPSNLDRVRALTSLGYALIESHDMSGFQFKLYVRAGH